MNLTADVLDQQVVDSRQKKTGKVDGIALEVSEGMAPRVAYLDIGPEVVARRLSKRLASFIHKRRRPFHVPWSVVEKVDVSVTIEMDTTDSPASDAENWLREHIIEKIPGCAHRKHQEKND